MFSNVFHELIAYHSSFPLSNVMSIQTGTRHQMQMGYKNSRFSTNISFYL